MSKHFITAKIKNYRKFVKKDIQSMFFFSMFKNVLRACCFYGFNHLHFWRGEPGKPLGGW